MNTKLIEQKLSDFFYEICPCISVANLKLFKNDVGHFWSDKEGFLTDDIKFDPDEMTKMFLEEVIEYFEHNPHMDIDEGINLLWADDEYFITLENARELLVDYE
jgi:hypothetical protein